ncbi:hypothetical protein [Mycobacteroides abscessus]|nr:hypothetical protein [Mycobacteroides abscessus]RIU40475.1 hypothetical protein D2E83_12055 [Mycobacteroides abscessus]
MNLSQIPGFGWSPAHHPIAEILEFLPEFRLSLFRATWKPYQVRRTIRSPRFWNFFLNSDFRSSERLGNRIKFVNLSQIPGFGWSPAHHPIAEILEFLPEFRLSLFRATWKPYQVR